jgi:3-methyl-2-oxobutanoate hydroxymethyltransferase
MVTAYDFPTAQVAQQCGVDILLVGDSVGTNVLGLSDVSQVTMRDMEHHVKAVGRAAQESFVLADLPYHSYETPRQALKNAALLMTGKADGIKIEGEAEIVDIVRFLSESNIPVCAHIGYTPQLSAGKPQVQGKDAQRARQLISGALALQQAGAFLIVLELITEQIAAVITHTLSIPTIGIGSGPQCDGQVLVMHDLIGMTGKSFKHVKAFGSAREQLCQSISDYAREVRQGTFPTSANASTMPPEELAHIKKWLDEKGLTGNAQTP